MSLVGEMGHNPRLLAVSCPRPTPPPLPILIRLVLFSIIGANKPALQALRGCCAPLRHPRREPPTHRKPNKFSLTLSWSQGDERCMYSVWWTRPSSTRRNTSKKY